MAIPDRDAKSDLAISLISVQVLLATSHPATARRVMSVLVRQGSSGNFIAGPAVTLHQISIAVSPGGRAITLADRSATGRCWYARQETTSGVVKRLRHQIPPLGSSFNGSPAGEPQKSCAASGVANARLVGPWRPTFPN